MGVYHLITFPTVGMALPEQRFRWFPGSRSAGTTGVSTTSKKTTDKRERRSPRGAALCLRNRWPGRSGGRGGRQRRRRRPLRRPFRGGTRGCYANSDHGQRRGGGRWKRTGQDGCGDREPTVGRKREARAGAREEEVGEVASAEKGEGRREKRVSGRGASRNGNVPMVVLYLTAMCLFF
ncbi:hypothetical protein BHM03_00023137 [Ensete ventricosum]|nr:hypothetical protein BHM03_00023137 [Ensete ventricosum]